MEYKPGKGNVVADMLIWSADENDNRDADPDSSTNFEFLETIKVISVFSSLALETVSYQRLAVSTNKNMTFQSVISSV